MAKPAPCRLVAVVKHDGIDTVVGKLRDTLSDLDVQLLPTG